MMARRSSSTLTLTLPILILLSLSLILSIATLACAAQALHLFDSQQSSNPWLLPIWRGHFDLRGLRLVLAASTAILLLDCAAAIVLGVKSRLPHNKSIASSLPPPFLFTATTSLLSATLALPSLTLPLVLNARSPARDTLQSWTCGWVGSQSGTGTGTGTGAEGGGIGVPAEFAQLCGESRFATYAPIALLIVHLALAAVCVVEVRRVGSGRGLDWREGEGGGEDGEKMVELGRGV